MKYVDMHVVAFDPQNVAFPGLGNCHGIVYVNANGLFAYHLAGMPTPTRTAGFIHFVTNHPNGGGPGLGLYGFCPSNRFDDPGHKAELQPFATGLNYTGRIRAHRWNIEQLGWGTTFVDVYHNQGSIMSSIEKFEDIKETGPNPWPADLRYNGLNAGALAVPVARAECTLYALRTGKPTFFLPHDL
jgi:hypothetical protein